MGTIRTGAEIALMRESGRIVAVALSQVLKHVKVGITTKELDNIAEQEIKNGGGKISFRTVEDYPYTTCITVNDEVVHGMPSDYALKQGDVVGIDIGALYKGWHSDLAESVIVQPTPADAAKVTFLDVGKKAMLAAIDQARAGNKVGDISHVMQSIIESAGYNVVRALTGHGVGRELHEEPIIPCFGKAGKGLLLRAGMTIAVEAIYNAGTYEVMWKNDDGWTISSADGSDAGLFERTILITDGVPEILTALDDFLGINL